MDISDIEDPMSGAQAVILSNLVLASYLLFHRHLVPDAYQVDSVEPQVSIHIQHLSKFKTRFHCQLLGLSTVSCYYCKCSVQLNLIFIHSINQSSVFVFELGHSAGGDWRVSAIVHAWNLGFMLLSFLQSMEKMSFMKPKRLGMAALGGI